MKNPMRTFDKSKFGLAVRDIYGFNVFGNNRVKRALEEEPLTMFLHHIARSFPCAAHVGGIGLPIGGGPTTLGPSTPEHFYTQNRVGLSGALFYDQDGKFYCDRDSCFFPQVRTPSLGADDEDFSALVSYDALALMLGATLEKANEMSARYNAPFPGHEKWLEVLTGVYDVVLLTGGDAGYVEAWAREPEKFGVLDQTIALIGESITASDWYRQNESELIWDATYGLCYVLPASLDF